MKHISGGVCAPLGFIAGGIHCGIRHNRTKKDLMMIVADDICTAASVYTQNLAAGAPILVTKKHLQNGKAKAIITNSGIANTSAYDGEENAKIMCEVAARIANCDASDIIVASTGVIGQPLPTDPILAAENALRESLSKNGADCAANAIMTTDTFPKQVAIEFEIGGKICKIGAMAKGSGMINPNMATMLCFVTTDVDIDEKCLNHALKSACDLSLNMVSVDGDTSTNDMTSILASGLAGNAKIVDFGDDYAVFENALTQIMTKLARDIAKDGEGATTLIECVVSGAQSEKSARIIAKTIINSSLVKAAIFGKDANWGRIICAAGYAGVDFDVNLVNISFANEIGMICVCENGKGLPFDEDLALKILECREVQILVNLKQGTGTATAWGCDLTYDYVKINGDYRT